MSESKEVIVTVEGVSKSYDGGLVPALQDVFLVLREGESVALMGPSGCGKSTLLNIIGSLDLPSSGSVHHYIDDKETLRTLHRLRREVIGFIFQAHHLLPVLTLQENVELPLLADRRIDTKTRRQKATRILDVLGLGAIKDAYASRVSGGERQRTAIARALVNDPRLILADEPTGSVDSKTADIILQRLLSYTKEHTSTLMIATHDERIAKLVDRVIRMKDGKIIAIEQNLSPRSRLEA